MTFVSHAQNFEDVILWRALRDTSPGCYIDVGANDPMIDSVSLAFYERGWRGVHVEPMPEYAAKLRAARPDETVIEAAIGVGEAPTELLSIAGTGLTTARACFAQQHREAGYSTSLLHVPTRTLASVFAVLGARDIHWLKIDVEGMERDVLASWNGSSARPWIVVVESTLPNSPVENWEDWEPLLLALDYRMVYFDGLNRFYVHKDRAHIASAFGPGPNYFDDFVLAEHSGFVQPLADAHQLPNPREAELSHTIEQQGAEIARLHAAVEEQAAFALKAAVERDLATEGLYLAREVLAEREADLAQLIAQRETDAARLHAVIEEQSALAITASQERDLALEELGTMREAASGREMELTHLSGEVARLHKTVADQSVWGQAAMEHHRLLATELDAIRGSTSWRMTSPMREAVTFMRRGMSLVQSVPRVAARRAASVVRAKAPALYHRIAVNRGLRKVFYAVGGNRPDRVVIIEPAVTPAAPAASPAAVAAMPLGPMDATRAATLSHLHNRMRPWTIGTRLDGN